MQGRAQRAKCRACEVAGYRAHTERALGFREGGVNVRGGLGHGVPRVPAGRVVSETYSWRRSWEGKELACLCSESNGCGVNACKMMGQRRVGQEDKDPEKATQMSDKLEQSFGQQCLCGRWMMRMAIAFIMVPHTPSAPQSMLSAPPPTAPGFQMAAGALTP